VNFYYNPNSLQVKVEEGVSSAIQKQVAIEEIIKMMQASPLFAEFINTEGLETIISNMDIRGIDELKAQAAKFMEMMRQRKEQMEKAQMEAQAQGDPQLNIAREQAQTLMQIETMKVQQQAEKAEGEHAIQAAKVANEKQKNDMAFIKMMADIEEKQSKISIEQERLSAENARTAIENVIEMAKHHHEVTRNERNEE
jgi:hypothetical protein